MNAFWKLSKRIFVLFFRDKASIFFSVLSSALVLLVFMIFLSKNAENSSAANLLPEFGYLFQQWLMAGILYTTTFSAALNAMGQYPDDRHLKISSDLMVTPVRRSVVVSSYVFGSTMTAFCMTAIILGLTYVNILIRFGKFPRPLDILLVLLAILVSSVFHTVFAFFLATFTKTARGYNSLGLVFHSISGFLAAIYLPLGDLSAGVQNTFAFSPFVHAASLLRKAYMFSSLGTLEDGSLNAVVRGFRIFMGIDLAFGDLVFKVWQSLLFLTAISAILFLLSVRRISRSRDRL